MSIPVIPNDVKCQWCLNAVNHFPSCPFVELASVRAELENLRSEIPNKNYLLDLLEQAAADKRRLESELESTKLELGKAKEAVCTWVTAAQDISKQNDALTTDNARLRTALEKKDGLIGQAIETISLCLDAWCGGHDNGADLTTLQGASRTLREALAPSVPKPDPREPDEEPSK